MACTDALPTSLLTRSTTGFWGGIGVCFGSGKWEIIIPINQAATTAARIKAGITIYFSGIGLCSLITFPFGSCPKGPCLFAASFCFLMSFCRLFQILSLQRKHRHAGGKSFHLVNRTNSVLRLCRRRFVHGWGNSFLFFQLPFILDMAQSLILNAFLPKQGQLNLNLILTLESS